MSWEQIALLVQMSEMKTQSELAEFFGISQTLVSRFLTKFADTRPVAKRRLHGAAQQFAEDVIKASGVAAQRGDASPALEALDRIEALPKRVSGSSGAKVVVIVGGGTNPAALVPDFSTVIDIEKAPDS